ncbi:MAG: DAK2 domain-containing protein [Chloroflexota bacterium]
MYLMNAQEQLASHPSGTLDGRALRALFTAAGRALDANRARVNSLNVFPVPDGDTGTNMSLTMRSIMADAEANPSDHAGQTAAQMARSALLAARGNSGLILAQLFKGLASAAEGHDELSPIHIAKGMSLGADAAYRSVPTPREGTMLTVMREAGEAATSFAERGLDLPMVLRVAADSARDSVARTPTLLPVLRDAGVVDSGGYGLFVMLSGALEYLEDRGGGGSTFPPPLALGIHEGAVSASVVSQDFVKASQEIEYGYCTVFIIEGESLSQDEIRARVAELGESAVVVGDESAVKVHVHPLDPGPVISYGVSLGTISGVQILNMDEQTREWASEQEEAARIGQYPASDGGEEQALDIAIVAVASGEGMKALLSDSGLGACYLVTGGDSMNPSVQDLLVAAEKAPAKSVIILPNNKNITAAARQVQELTDKEVHVVETRSMQQGVAAVLAFSHELPASENAELMAEAAEGVRSGAVCYAVRDATVSGRQVSNGDVMALLDDELLGTAPDPLAGLVTVMRAVDGMAELVTIYTGRAVHEEEASRAVEMAKEAAPHADIEVVFGGQPFYHFLLAAE